ncbi:hypothetical protein RF55_1095 [Lasius niger]|uniref:Uncharacterized protein n=1 Tax=Lasius niger TaxID=67767 RepID=A0A0J7P1Y2_LASNI|nr:hypothetical protein RF55_1095 [Lasius niger]
MRGRSTFFHMDEFMIRVIFAKHEAASPRVFVKRDGAGGGGANGGGGDDGGHGGDGGDGGGGGGGSAGGGDGDFQATIGSDLRAGNWNRGLAARASHTPRVLPGPLSFL